MKHVTVGCILVSLFLVSCASTPQQVIEGGNHYTYYSKKSPKVAAECLARTAKNVSASAVTDIIPGENKNTYQVTMNSVVGDGGTWAVFLTKPLGKQTIIDAYVTNSALFVGGKEVFVNSISDKCL